MPPRRRSSRLSLLRSERTPDRALIDAIINAPGDGEVDYDPLIDALPDARLDFFLDFEDLQVATPEHDLSSFTSGTFLMLACALDKPFAAHALLSRGSGLNVTNALGQSALFIACSFGSELCTRLLCIVGAVVDLPGVDSCTPMRIACTRGALGCVREICKHGANVRACALLSRARVSQMQQMNDAITR